MEAGELFLAHTFPLCVQGHLRASHPVLTASRVTSRAPATSECCPRAHSPQLRAGVRPASGLQTSGRNPLYNGTPQGGGLQQYWGGWLSQGSVPEVCPPLSGWAQGQRGSGIPGDMIPIFHLRPPGDPDRWTVGPAWPPGPLMGTCASLLGTTFLGCSSGDPPASLRPKRGATSHQSLLLASRREVAGPVQGWPGEQSPAGGWGVAPADSPPVCPRLSCSCGDPGALPGGRHLRQWQESHRAQYPAVR